MWASNSLNRFSLLLLEDREYYFDDYSAYYYPPPMSTNNIPAQKRKLKGRLKVCSQSIFFDPEDTRLPITRFPFKNITSLSRISALALLWENPNPVNPNEEFFCVECKTVVEMKANNLNVPWKFVNSVGNHRFSLNFESLGTFFPRVENLYQISQKPERSASKQLRDLIQKREELIVFNMSWLVEFSEKPIFDSTALRVLPLVNSPGRILITNSRIYVQSLNNVDIEPVKKFTLSSIVRVFKRRHQLRQTGLEFFFDNNNQNNNLFLAFSSVQERDQVYELLLHQSEMSPKAVQDQRTLNQTLKKWQMGQISNYEYLLYLNDLAGRTFNDLAQYPVFPWTITNFTSQELDLNDPQNYRDLSKPIGALNEKRLAGFKERFDSIPDDQPKFLYGTHYSTPGFVLYYLVRKAPEYMLKLQCGKFDAPDRMFDSVDETWFSVYSNPADVKELIPEFYDPELKGDFLINSQHLPLGTKQNGKALNDVVLPPWSTDPEDFVKKLRQALESDYVSANIHHWIDLIFGYKQTGENAIRFDNLFYHLTYEGAVDIDKLDERTRESLETQIDEFGQTPKQLFGSPHPSRFNDVSLSISTSEPNLSVSMSNSPSPGSPSLSSSQVQGDQTNEWGQISTNLHLSFSQRLHRDTISSAVLSKDGSTLYTVSQDSTLKMFSLNEKRQLRSISNVSQLALSSCSLTPDEHSIVIGSWDNNIYLYSIAYGRVVDTLSAHDDAVSGLKLVGDKLISGSWDSTVKLWQLRPSGFERTPIFDLVDNEDEVKSVQLDNSATLAASGADDGRLIISDLRINGSIANVRIHSDTITGIQFLGEGRLLTCSLDGTLKLVEVTGREILSMDTSSPAKCLWGESEIGLVGKEDGNVGVYNLLMGEEMHSYPHPAPVDCLVGVSGSSSPFFVSGSQGKIHVWKKK